MKAARERSRQTIERLGAVDPRPLTFSHPRLGSLDLAQWWMLQAWHDGIHLEQLRGGQGRAGVPQRVKIKLRNPSREVELPGRKRVKDVLRELDILPGTVLVIRGSDLLTADEVVGDGDELEVRPVMSGGSAASVSNPK